MMFKRNFGFGLMIVALLAAALVFVGCGGDDDDSDPKVPKTWVLATLPEGITGSFSNIAYGRNVFVAATNKGEIVWSADGIEWNKATLGELSLNNLGANYVFFGNNEFLVVDRSDSGSGGIPATPPGNWAKSTDGKNWTAVTGVENRAAGGGAYGNGTYVIGSSNGNVVIGANTTWTTKATDIASINWVNGVAYGNRKFVVTGMNGKIGYSANNGNTWVDSTPLVNNGEEKLFGGATGGSGSQSAVNQVVFGNGLFMAVGGNPAPSTQIAATSPDGITWKQTDEIKVTGTGNKIHVGYGAGVFIIAHESGDTVPASYSTDAFNWTAIDETNLTGVNGIAYGAGKFVMVGSGGITYSTPE